MADLKGKTIIITGASRGIGRAMAVKFARDGANLVVAAKTAEPHPKLPGTIYTLSKYGMTMLNLGMSAEFNPYGIAVNCLWPRTIIATAAIEFAVGSRDLFKNCRKPDIMADAAYAVITTEKCALTGQCLIDEQVLSEHGVSDFDHYAVEPGNKDALISDLYL